MTGTAMTEAEEFSSIYGLEVLVIPTNVPVVRNDIPDVIYKTRNGKYQAVANKIKELHEKGQPVLVGTVSIEQSETLSNLLKKLKTPHKVLNAKHHEQEAEIIMNAGKKNAVTIATNMAGRGTDIKLGEGVKALGGLHVIGTERHEARRIDNQLRGRSGRQGDAGASQFYVSVEDDLMRLFGGEKVKALMERLGVPEDMPIENRFISNSIERAQKKVEGHNFDIRKHLVEYDDVMNKHREIVYKKRNHFMLDENVKNDILLLMEREAENLVKKNAPGKDQGAWDYEGMLNSILTLYRDPAAPLSLDDLKAESRSREGLIEFVKHHFWEQYARKEAEFPAPKFIRKIEKSLGLQIVDRFWMDHINKMSRLREKVAFAGYAGKNPLLEYKNQAFEMLEELLTNIGRNTVGHLLNLQLEVQTKEEAEAKKKEEESKALAKTKQELGTPTAVELTAPTKTEISTPAKTDLAKPDEKYLPKAKKKAKKKRKK
ncbi:hypothetical protein HOG48_05300 [Candidatus Peregrinibacteria bacterium]|nr:hypothetical protein [Candidatus Peregrinibacteria bacterium]